MEPMPYPQIPITGPIMHNGTPADPDKFGEATFGDSIELDQVTDNLPA